MRKIRNFFKLLNRAIECSQMSRVERYLASSSSLEKLERRQRELMLKGL